MSQFDDREDYDNQSFTKKLTEPEIVNLIRVTANDRSVTDSAFRTMVRSLVGPSSVPEQSRQGYSQFDR